MVMKNMLLATEGGLGSGETPIFPVQIFRVKEGVNYNPERPELRPVQAGHALLSAKRLFPNFSFLDAPFNVAVLQAGTPGDGDRLHGLPHARHGQRVRPRPRDRARPRQPVVHVHQPAAPGHPQQGRPRSVLRPAGRASWRSRWGSSTSASRSRRARRCTTAPFLMGQGVWIDSEKLAPERRAARGAQARHAVHGLHRPGRDARWRSPASTTARSQEAQNLGLEIIGHHARLPGPPVSQERRLNYAPDRHARPRACPAASCAWTATRYGVDSRA